MLLTEDEQLELVNRIIAKAKALLAVIGMDEEDSATGFVHRECRIDCFVIMEHQRHKVKEGFVKTNGLDLWLVESGSGKRVLSVNYMPFEMKTFLKSGKASWIERLLTLSIPRQG